ncbi:MAG: hypothetical protein KC442_15630 [Thermomicrobiales bacterium]|nr:hypothetical protein [Thermomicrobiales bacterium]
MDTIDDSSGWATEGLGIAIRMQGGDLAQRSRLAFYLRWTAVILSATLLLVLASVTGWFAWRALTRGAEEPVEADTPDSAPRG